MPGIIIENLENEAICEGCGSVCRAEELTKVESLLVCPSCASRPKTKCSVCGTLSRLNYALEKNHFACRRCYGEAKRKYPIWNYSTKPDPRFYKMPCEEDERLYMGVELEVDGGDISWSAAMRVKRTSPEIYCKRDGSLSENGFEIVTHPATLAYHMESFPWIEIIQDLHKFHYRSHKTSTCGLHVHVSRNFFGNTGVEQDANIAKLILLVERFWNGYIVPFSRRDLSRLNHWAKKPDITFPEGTPIEEIVRQQRRMLCRDHYNGINIIPEETVEFRMFRGSMKYETIIATLQFVWAISQFAKKVELNEIDRTYWFDIFDGLDREKFKILFEYMDSMDILEAPERVFRKRTSGDCETIKEGDFVVVREWDDLANEFGIDCLGSIPCKYTFTPNMVDYCGAIARVITREGKRLLLRFEQRNQNMYSWSTDMVRRVSSEQAPLELQGCF